MAMIQASLVQSDHPRILRRSLESSISIAIIQVPIIQNDRSSSQSTKRPVYSLQAIIHPAPQRLLKPSVFRAPHPASSAAKSPIYRGIRPPSSTTIIQFFKLQGGHFSPRYLEIWKAAEEGQCQHVPIQYSGLESYWSFTRLDLQRNHQIRVHSLASRHSIPQYLTNRHPQAPPSVPATTRQPWPGDACCQVLLSQPTANLLPNI